MYIWYTYIYYYTLVYYSIIVLYKILQVYFVFPQINCTGIVYIYEGSINLIFNLWPISKQTNILISENCLNNSILVLRKKIVKYKK